MRNVFFYVWRAIKCILGKSKNYIFTLNSKYTERNARNKDLNWIIHTIHQTTNGIVVGNHTKKCDVQQPILCDSYHAICRSFNVIIRPENIHLHFWLFFAPRQPNDPQISQYLSPATETFIFHVILFIDYCILQSITATHTKIIFRSPTRCPMFIHTLRHVLSIVCGVVSI